MAKFMVFDVESIGLHGEGFSVGWVVIDEHGEEVDAGEIGCHPDSASGPIDSRLWVRDNVKSALSLWSPRSVREHFWWEWKQRKAEGYLLAADVAWPVEANFLSACVRENQPNRDWEGPYPLIDISSIRFAAGFDPLATEERKPNELPAHNALCDARQSARLLIEALAKIEQEQPNAN